MRPADLDYKNNPEKFENDIESIKLGLGSLDEVFIDVDSFHKQGNKKQTILFSIKIAKISMKLLYLYESTGLSFVNHEVGYPHYLLYKLESHLEGKKPDRDKKLLLLLTGKNEKELDFENLDEAILYNQAKKIFNFTKSLIILNDEFIKKAKERLGI